MATVPQTAPQRLLLSPTRVFGDDLAPPRQIYITLIPAVLSLTGVLSWAMGDEAGMVLASAVATAVAVYTLWGWLFRKAPTRFSTLMGMTLLLGYGGGTLNSWATLSRGSLTLADVMGLNNGILARGIGAVLISSAVLFFFGEIFEKPIFGREFHFHIDERTRALVYVGALAVGAGFVTHSLAIEGIAQSEGHVSIPGMILFWCYPPLTAISVSAFLTAERMRGRVLSGAAALILLMVFSLMGRRISIYTSIEVIFVLGLTGYYLRGKLFQKILLGLGLGAIIVACSLTFMVLRIAGNATPHKVMTVGSRIRVAGKLVQRGGAYSLASEETQKNVASRTFVLSFFANVLDASSRKTPALGRDAVGYFEDAIPRVIYPEKSQDFSEEGLVDQMFGFSYGDQPNSILTAGATDFGFPGVIVYPILLILLMRIVFDFAAKRLRTVPLMFVALSFIFAMLETESGLNGYFVVIRNAFPFGILIALFMAIPVLKLRTD